MNTTTPSASFTPVNPEVMLNAIGALEAAAWALSDHSCSDGSPPTDTPASDFFYSLAYGLLDDAFGPDWPEGDEDYENDPRILAVDEERERVKERLAAAVQLRELGGDLGLERRPRRAEVDELEERRLEHLARLAPRLQLVQVEQGDRDA